MSISNDEITIHLTEHYGDATPGSKVFIVCTEIKNIFNWLQSRPYKYYQTGLLKILHGSLCVEITDPFGNRLLFNEFISVQVDNP